MERLWRGRASLERVRRKHCFIAVPLPHMSKASLRGFQIERAPSQNASRLYTLAQGRPISLWHRGVYIHYITKKNTTYPAIQMRVFLVYINLDDLKAHIDESQLSSTKTSGASNEHEPPTPKKNRQRRDSAKHKRRTNHCQLWIVKTVLLSLYLPSKAFASLKLYG